MYYLWYMQAMGDPKRLSARFFMLESGRMPVRDWLLDLSPQDRKSVGDDIRVAEFGWPVGMPLCRPIMKRKGLWEIRSDLSNGRIARILFCIQDGAMVLLHGFVKKSRKTSNADLELASKRMRGLK
ncbi:type II toxin-antitoxin system RelE/ParE family toxin [Breoghania sp. L-A4]|uniref:type II toxin-antitoxin system RelE/ParE family toxin n=1 Tax=Breoghania sp. L-A4 TaxID=2304600 RepID=UPI0032046A1D